MDAADLARWTRFAAKGGIGKCAATRDCIAESADDLMFLKVGYFIFSLRLGLVLNVTTGRRNYSPNAIT